MNVVTREGVRRFVAINNIPTPYRIHFFRSLYRALVKRNIAFEAWFMARTEPGRFWPFEPATWHFPYRLFPGIHPRLARISFHMNPSMLISLAATAPTWLLVGGSWVFPTVASVLAFRAIILRQTNVLLWSEANESASEHASRATRACRCYLYSKADSYVVPGAIAIQTLKTWQVPERPLLTLPNIVDEAVFGQGVVLARKERSNLRTRLGLKDDDLLVVIPARLHEATKGVINFLSAIETVWDSRLRILIAGDGPDRSRMEDHFQHNKTITFLGHQTEEEMVRLFASADLLALPSWKDPNPLVVIEGLWAGLPIMISKFCGNWPEALEEGVNGWLIDPADHGQIRLKMQAFLALPASTRAEFSLASRRIASRFETAAVVNSFIEQLGID